MAMYRQLVTKCMKHKATWTLHSAKPSCISQAKIEPAERTIMNTAITMTIVICATLVLITIIGKM